jgi:general secretion pathway protein D
VTASSFFPRGRPALIAAAVALLLAGCAAQREHSKGLTLLEEGQSRQGVESLKRAAEMDPSNLRYRADFLNRRDATLHALLEQAQAERVAGEFDAATQHYREALRIVPGSDAAAAGLAATATERRQAALLQQAERALQANQADPALEAVRRVLRETPTHAAALALEATLLDRKETDRRAREEQLQSHAAFRRPVTLSFRDVPLKMVFEAMSRAAGVNVIVDRDVKSDQRTTIYVKDAALEDAIDVILLQNQLEKRVLNGSTLLVYPATAAKQKELAELKVRSFQLSNIDAGVMATILKGMVKTKDIVTDAKANLLVMRDTPDAVALAERLIAANDVPDPEVMLEVQVLEIASSRVSEIGLKLPTSVTVGTPSAGAGSALTVGDLRALTRNDLTVSPLAATLNLMLQDGSTNLLASPRIRTRNKEKARIHVGDKLPQITNLIQAQQTGANSVVTGSIQYVDVGIKLDVEPQVYADGDVGIKLALEVSNVTDTIQTESGRAYQIGSRSAQTVLRLHDGETQVLGGLISDTDRQSAQKVPGVGQLPVVGRLFSNQSGDAKKTEIVLSITPHIVRPAARVDTRYADAWSGSESFVRDRALRIDPVAMVRAEQARPDPEAAVAATAATAPTGGNRAPVPRSIPAPQRAAPIALPNAAPVPTAAVTTGSAGKAPPPEPEAAAAPSNAASAPAAAPAAAPASSAAQ